MSKFVLIILFLAVYLLKTYTYAQSITIDGKEWAKDSTACLGIRGKNYATLIKELSVLRYKITMQTVVDTIGKPNITKKSKKLIYHYYYIVGEQGCNPVYYTDVLRICLTYSKKGMLYDVNSIQP